LTDVDLEALAALEHDPIRERIAARRRHEARLDPYGPARQAEAHRPGLPERDAVERRLIELGADRLECRRLVRQPLRAGARCQRPLDTPDPDTDEQRNGKRPATDHAPPVHDRTIPNRLNSPLASERAARTASTRAPSGPACSRRSSSSRAVEGPSATS